MNGNTTAIIDKLLKMVLNSKIFQWSTDNLRLYAHLLQMRIYFNV